MHQIRVLGIVLAAVLGLAACEINTAGDGFNLGLSRGSASDTWTRSYAVHTGGRLELINVSGRIQAEPASGDTVDLVGVRTAKASTDEAAKALLDKIEMREETGPTRVRVEVRPPRLGGWSSHDVKWAVKVPKGVLVDLRTTNGAVVIASLDAEVRAQVVNGSIEARGLTAPVVEATTVNGGVVVELASPLGPDGRVELQCVNGGVSLRLPRESRATISARAVNGGVQVEDLDLAKGTEENTRRRVAGTLNGGGARVELSTTNGGVRLAGVAARPPAR
jgi:hypothetical protein